jgi:hypothetical protein
MKQAVPIALLCALGIVASASAQERAPIIDMHLHAPVAITRTADGEPLS